MRSPDMKKKKEQKGRVRKKENREGGRRREK